MNEDLRLGFASDDFAGTKWKNLTGTAPVERRHRDGYSRLLAPHQRAVGGVQGLPGPAGRGSLEEQHVGDAMCIVYRLLYHIAHVAHIARTRGVDVQWLAL